jgi:hypothetical protein
MAPWPWRSRLARRGPDAPPGGAGGRGPDGSRPGRSLRSRFRTWPGAPLPPRRARDPARPAGPDRGARERARTSRTFAATRRRSGRCSWPPRAPTTCSSSGRLARARRALARRLPALLPRPTEAEALEILRIHTLAKGALPRLERPLRAPTTRAAPRASWAAGAAPAPARRRSRTTASVPRRAARVRARRARGPARAARGAAHHDRPQQAQRHAAGGLRARRGDEPLPVRLARTPVAPVPLHAAGAGPLRGQGLGPGPRSPGPAGRGAEPAAAAPSRPPADPAWSTRSLQSRVEVARRAPARARRTARAVAELERQARRHGTRAGHGALGEGARDARARAARAPPLRARARADPARRADDRRPRRPRGDRLRGRARRLVELRAYERMRSGV